MSTHPPVIVVGGGWAGLAAAVALSRYDIPVTLLESAKQLGGRARRVQFGANDSDERLAGNSKHYGIDNGQHLLVGAYDSTLSLMHTVGVDEGQVLRRKDLALNIFTPRARPIHFKTGKAPAPLNLLLGLIGARGLPLRDRIRAILFCQALAKQNFTLPHDETCLSLFRRYHQSDKLIKSLWEPLCLATLNTHINEASALIFLRTLRETFAYSRQNSNLLFTATDLGRLFPDPALDFIERNRGSIKLGQRVTGVQISDNTITAASTDTDNYPGAHIILATPYYITEQLISKVDTLKSLADQLGQFDSNPIVTVYLQYPEHVTLGREMIGMVDTTSQWILDRKLCDQPGLLSVVISGSGPHMDMDNDALTQRVSDEIAQQFPQWPAPERSMVIREKRATFHCCTGINDIRPGNRTAVEGLWLAGDYTDTGLPATLESAVRSGIRCAKGIRDQLALAPQN